MCLPLTVLAETLAAPVPTNSTSSAFFNLAAECLAFVAGGFVGADYPAHVGWIACGGRAGFLVGTQVGEVETVRLFWVLAG